MQVYGAPSIAAAPLRPVVAARPTRRVSVVIPAKNEAANIGWVLERLPADVDEVVLVDGRSEDATIEVAQAIRPDIVIIRDDEPGKGCALRAGVAAASGDYVVMLDADGSMDPVEIPRFIAQLDAGHDLVKGSRFLPGGGTADMTRLRDVGNRGLLLVSNLLFSRRHSDLCYGFAAFRREAFESLALTATGFEIEAALFLRATRHRMRVIEVPSFEAPRRFGNSNLNTFRDGFRVLRTILAERLRPARPAPLDNLVELPSRPFLAATVFAGGPAADGEPDLVIRDERDDAIPPAAGAATVPAHEAPAGEAHAAEEAPSPAGAEAPIPLYPSAGRHVSRRRRAARTGTVGNTAPDPAIAAGSALPD